MNMFIQSECQWKQENGSALHQWIKQQTNPNPNEVDIVVYGALYRMPMVRRQKRNTQQPFVRLGQVFNRII